MANKINIPINGKVRVYWDDKPENYSKHGKTKIKTQFAKKYNLSRKSINVIFRPIKLDENGEKITITGSNLENVMDSNYQRQLMKEWIIREDRKVNFDSIIKLDDMVNMDVTSDMSELRQRKYKLKWIKIDNFLCFGDVEPIFIDRLKGLVCVTSEPKNQGGKTTFSIDAPLFLYFGRTTKTDKNEEIFNQFSDSDKLVVRGMIEIDDEEYLLERVMTRKPKKGGGWTISNKVNYIELLPDGEEKTLNGEDAKRTGKLIKDTLGTEDDFMLTILATGNNLEELIESTPTDKGKLLTRFVGLEVIEEKERIARKKYNEFTKTMKSNIYNIIDLEDEITECKVENLKFDELYLNNSDKLKIAKQDIEDFNKERDLLIEKKHNIDKEVLKLSPSRLDAEINKITNDGKLEAKKLKKVKNDIDAIGEIDFDEDAHHELVKTKRAIEKQIDRDENQVERYDLTISDLEESEICPTCKRALEDVDNSEEIKKVKAELVNLRAEMVKNEETLIETNEAIGKMMEDQAKATNKAKLELLSDRIDVDLSSMRIDLKGLLNDKKSYDLNVNAIEFNKKVESEVLLVGSRIQMRSIERDKHLSNIARIKADVLQNEKDIKIKEDIIKDINIELVREKVFKVYIEMVGKKGISKIVLRSVLPIINSELHRLLDEVTDFDVEMQINDKNDVEFYLIKDGVTKKLKSGSGLEKTTAALALRFVLGQISSLPKPNFIAFDEVLGKIADENLDTVRLLFDKASDMFETILLITHIPVVKDWADRVIIIEKKDNISKISVQ